MNDKNPIPKRDGVGLYGRKRRVQKREEHLQFTAERQALIDLGRIKPKGRQPC